MISCLLFFNDTATTEIYTLSLHDALPISEEVQSVAAKGTPVYSGLFICRDWRNKESVVDPENSGLLPSEIGAAVKGSMEAGAAGICLFTPYSMTEEHWKALDEAIK